MRFATVRTDNGTTAARLDGAELEETLLHFHALAQREIDTLCSVCQQKHGPALTNEASLSDSGR